MEIKKLFPKNLFRQALEDAHHQRVAIEADIVKTKARIHELRTLPLPREDFLAGLFEGIDRRAAIWATDQFPRTLAPFIASADSDLNVPVLESTGSYSEVNKVFADVLYGMLGPTIKAAMKDRVMAMAWPAKTGPTRAARRAEMGELTKHLAEQEGLLKEISKDARAVGLDLGRLANVQTGSET